MGFLRFVKDNMTSLPYSLGKPISYLPYGVRPKISRVYRQRVNEMDATLGKNTAFQQNFIFCRVKDIAVFAKNNIPFYRNLYRENNVDPERFKNFNDLFELPIVTKEDLQNVSLAERSAEIDNCWKVNTGGSTGQPLEMLIESSSVGHEWAHMHKVWSVLGFSQKDLRLVFGGRSDVGNGLQYDSARHQFNVDSYHGWSEISDKLIPIFKRYPIKYLHGYPSAIFDFVLWLESHKHPLLSFLQSNIKGVFLGSEFPSPVLRRHVEDVLSCPSISWYGHTERAVLAYEKDSKEIYHPFVTYGFSEVFGEERLISTSYYNRASPLIRYDTGDLINPSSADGILENFRIKKGRAGEYIVDEFGNKVFLTGLIYGRHHEVFNFARHVQVFQPARGEALVLIVPRKSMTEAQASLLFDQSNVAIKFQFRILNEPVRTLTGKTPLLVRNPGSTR